MLASFAGCGRYPCYFEILISTLLHAGNTTLSNTANIACSWATVKEINENLLGIFNASYITLMPIKMILKTFYKKIVYCHKGNGVG